MIQQIHTKHGDNVEITARKERTTNDARMRNLHHTPARADR